jgi:hypothetical protein
MMMVAVMVQETHYTSDVIRDGCRSQWLLHRYRRVDLDSAAEKRYPLLIAICETLLNK